jgi:metal-sulfur cluster biosynthetic enzyme
MVSEDQVMQALGECYDPEIRGVSIVDLGLVYDVAIDNDNVNVKMTLTTPGCGMARYITEEARQRVEAIDGVNEVNVEIVWDPPWNPNMMNEETKKKLGFA